MPVRNFIDMSVKLAVAFLNEIVPYYMYFYFSNMNKQM